MTRKITFSASEEWAEEFNSRFSFGDNRSAWIRKAIEKQAAREGDPFWGDEPEADPEPVVETPGRSIEERMADQLADMDVPGRAARTEKARREAVRHAWNLLRDEGTATSRYLANSTFGAFWDDEDLGYSTSSRYPGYGLWDNCVRDLLAELPGVVPPGERGERWRFDEGLG